MPSDIYGAVEVRALFYDPEFGEMEPWVRCMDAGLLDIDADPVRYGCLFAGRGHTLWEPVAARRGLPADVSRATRADFERLAAVDAAVGNASWIGWDEIRALDMTVSARAGGVVTSDAVPAYRYFVEGEWPAEVPRPPVDGFGSWEVDGVSYEYRRLTRQEALGPGTDWDRAFGVLRALAGIYGDNGVRLVVWFD